jgi:hypothetical protein
VRNALVEADVVNLDDPVGGARGEPATVEVELGVVLRMERQRGRAFEEIGNANQLTIISVCPVSTAAMVVAIAGLLVVGDNTDSNLASAAPPISIGKD